jgi:hypothetical protein
LGQGWDKVETRLGQNVKIRSGLSKVALATCAVANCTNSFTKIIADWYVDLAVI